MKKRQAILLMAVALTSCIKIKGDFKGLYSYYDQTNKDYPGLLVRPDPQAQICNIIKSEHPQVIVANGKQIKACLEKPSDAVLYVWDAKCHGRNCYSLKVVQRECRAKGIQLFVIAEFYDGPSMNQDYDLDNPIFGVDTKYYKSSVVDNYIPKFIWDVTSTEDRNVKFIRFRNGVFERKFMQLEDL